MPPLPDADALASLQLAYDRLQQQHQTLAAFLGTASHELRAPINQVISLHQLILEDLCESPEEEREFIGQANQAITRMLHNLDTLISLSKLDIGAISPVCEPIALGAVLNKVRQFTEMQCINRQCRLTINPGAEQPWVLSDARWLLQALISLVEAALAAGSTAITLERLEDCHSGEDEPSGNQAPDQPVVTLQLTCQAPGQQWPPNLPISPTLADSPHPPNDLPGTSPTLSLSPGFRYHLALRILGHLGCTIHASANTTDDQHRHTLRLPIAGEGRDAS
jgi:hypothetical protein